jgi:orotidine-5'-phosphate decarboxylase
MAKAPIAVALDAPNLGEMKSWVNAVSPFVSTVKVGLETFYRDGPRAVDVVSESGCDLFLDLKLHDIPNTVSGAASTLAAFQPTYLTVHASGGAAMIEAAALALPDTRITAVTILTSLDDQELERMGIGTPAQETVLLLAANAVAAGARALVCSPQEVEAVRGIVPSDIILITPGVRPGGVSANDQKRVATPHQAISAGADLLVIGRPITGAVDMSKAAQEIAAEVNAATSALSHQSGVQ